MLHNGGKKLIVHTRDTQNPRNCDLIDAPGTKGDAEFAQAVVTSLSF
ncbi:Hypothetical protein I595_1828 [Croceitalea dokdonensis DOKDO 023]|uniref:Uncharacterized protein n=1 Tax=Croceitalea dokdonensis DOKDO 023 TaxID=1300341 RepID=A0A0P7AK04_9FLAO|nr:Hypothetical protein I595_1828 [Croceitalea dokdonensis DOKDO 023]